MRRGLMLLAGMLVCLPFAGEGQIALGLYASRDVMPRLNTEWWLGPREIALAAACLFVLALTASMRRTQGDDPS